MIISILTLIIKALILVFLEIRFRKLLQPNMLFHDIKNRSDEASLDELINFCCNVSGISLFFHLTTVVHLLCISPLFSYFE